MSFTFPWRASDNIRSRIHAYLQEVDACLDAFAQASRQYLECGFCEGVLDLRNLSHRAESAADDLRREIQQTLYEHELLPESRGDLLSLLNAIDHIPGASQGSLNILFLEKPRLPAFLRNEFEDLVSLNTEAFGHIRDAVISLMEDPSRTRTITQNVDALESRSDQLQQKSLRLLFESELTLAEKLQIKDWIRAVGAISDRCESTADMINIIAIKRRI